MFLNLPACADIAKVDVGHILRQNRLHAVGAKHVKGAKTDIRWMNFADALTNVLSESMEPIATGTALTGVDHVTEPLVSVFFGAVLSASTAHVICSRASVD